MSEEDLELLVTLDDPEGAPEVDTFHVGCIRVPDWGREESEPQKGTQGT